MFKWNPRIGRAGRCGLLSKAALNFLDDANTFLLGSDLPSVCENFVGSGIKPFDTFMFQFTLTDSQ